ncbi:MAG: hypothetical protein R3Y46_06785 [Opitutales bacterium]
MESVATKEELGAFEKIALQDPKRALELSMYYQGWGKMSAFMYLTMMEISEKMSTRQSLVIT